MKKLDNFYYSKLDYHNYKKRLKELLNDKALQSLNIKHSIIGKTPYNYDLDCITIGRGHHELFIVAGSHGSEIISVDFILNFINSLKSNPDILESDIKLVIIPLQNPEGFDISTNTMKDIHDDNFTDISYEYYLKYKIDNLIAQTLKDLTNLVENNYHNLDLNSRLIMFKRFISTNPHLLYLRRLIPDLNLFQTKVLNLEKNEENFLGNLSLYVTIMNIAKQLQLENPTSYLEEIYNFFLNELHNLVERILLIEITNLNMYDRFSNRTYVNENQKLYQLMFENATFDGIVNKELAYETKRIYEKYKHPKGSQIAHDATGVGINLNANVETNPGIEAIKNNKTIYGLSSRMNIKNYAPGPLGVPTLDINNFRYAYENIVVENLIKTSIANGTYLATLLYHGTGGLIYYKPHQNLMDDKMYLSYLEFNEDLAHTYEKDTGYKVLNESDFTGYGDYLRRTYPGVLLIELSKMGGNPIGPYGDVDNIYEVFDKNSKALNSVIKKLNKRK